MIDAVIVGLGGWGRKLPACFGSGGFQPRNRRPVDWAAPACRSSARRSQRVRLLPH